MPSEVAVRVNSKRAAMQRVSNLADESDVPRMVEVAHETVQLPVTLSTPFRHLTGKETDLE